MAQIISLNEYKRHRPRRLKSEPRMCLYRPKQENKVIEFSKRRSVRYSLSEEEIIWPRPPKKPDKPGDYPIFEE